MLFYSKAKLVLVIVWVWKRRLDEKKLGPKISPRNMESIVHGVSGSGNEINSFEINKNQESVPIGIVTFIGVST
jgi:hypothetical protein